MHNLKAQENLTQITAQNIIIIICEYRLYMSKS